jgi:photosystem II stability/assembly factor-like uncharacterized protein
MSSDLKALTAINTRVWYCEGGVHPTRSPLLLALGKFSTDPSQSIGDEKRITAPDPNSFDRDITIGSVRGSEERATLGIGIRSTAQASIILGWKNKRCRVDLFALSGRCGNPQDFSEGGEKWVYFPDGKPSNHGYENFGAYGLDENNPTNEKVDMTSEEYYEFLYEREEQVGSAYTTRQVYTVDVYTGDDCEACPDPCDRVLATMAGVGATPGTKPVLLYSPDGGASWIQQSITTLFSNEGVADGQAIGDDIVYISNESCSLHWSDIDQIGNGTNVWAEVNAGFVAGKCPNAMYSADASHTWIVGNGGYIYFSKNHKVSVMAQDPGVATTQNLNAVHARDSQNVLVVGNSNAVVYTRNSGVTWQSVVGPAVGVNLGACWMWDENCWFVGEGAGGTGKLWLTTNQGISWSQVGLPSTYTRIHKIKFVSEAEGYLVVSTGSQGLILRTITAGNAWVTLPQGKSGVALNNSALTDVAVCSKYSNTAFAAGTAVGGVTGIIIKAGS